MNTESRHNVLLVEEDRDICETIQTVLKGRGFSVTIFSDSDEAIAFSGKTLRQDFSR
jgi:DNA-binding response OmpR family regulator